MQRSLERLRQRRREGLEGGFTLIELLIVIVILAILAAIVVFAVSNLTSSSAQASCRSDFQTAQTAAEAFKAQVGGYPEQTANYFSGAVISTAAPAAPTGSAASPEIQDMLATWNFGTGTNTVGPWLKSYPYNAGHYQIEMTNAGVIEVFDTSASPGVQITPKGPVSATNPATNATDTTSDCAGVS